MAETFCRLLLAASNVVFTLVPLGLEEAAVGGLDAGLGETALPWALLDLGEMELVPAFLKTALLPALLPTLEPPCLWLLLAWGRMFAPTRRSVLDAVLTFDVARYPPRDSPSTLKVAPWVFICFRSRPSGLLALGTSTVG